MTCEPDLFDSIDDEARLIGLVDDACLLVSDGMIAWVGGRKEFEAGGHRASKVIDAGGLAVIPGLVDAHTHTVFAGTREREYEMRVKGAGYMEIAARGGGINATVAAVRNASIDELVASGSSRVRSMLRQGTTTVEIKSGYGLSVEAELKMLRAIRRVGDETCVDVVATFMGAHEIPPELRANRDRYVDIVIDEMIPAVGEEGLAEFCDVFCEQGVFTADESRRILLRGKDCGLRPKIHADEFVESGGAAVAGEVGAISAGHLGHASREGLKAMKDAGTVAVLMPGVSVGLGRPEFADARGMIDMGLDVAVATDFNPGSSMVHSLLIVSSLACSFMKMTPAEVILAMTVGGAKAVGRQDRVGSIAPEKQADLILLEVPDFRYVPYHLGGEVVRMVIKNGNVVFDRTQD
ncbi:MAG: imidazolonepropionase [Candidatus Eisenbacteria bacterium]